MIIKLIEIFHYVLLKIFQTILKIFINEIGVNK